ncbi:MAG: bifunctional metallophosphatase/5'-nucleotidase [Oscillospiraceae bacterium]|jgi:2',3'-cyclic-nucleotide 2'-phosphodiesterase (5'-nucleotidase family)|nr:bifunctional metallophosphatase/5'-nucleotidase [Oscillospiraceae bacterium]
MNNCLKKLALIFAAVIILAAVPADAAEPVTDVSVVFTHDIHSHFDPDRVSAGGEVVEKGGLAGVKTIIDDLRQINPATFVLDGGDFSMGTPFQTIYSSDAAEIRMLGKLGYHATTLGNHEFDYKADGFTKMLNSAVLSGDALPELVISNIDWERTLADEAKRRDAEELKRALENYGYRDYAYFTEGGITVAVFGIMGREADSFAPESGLYFLDPVERSRAVVAKIKSEGRANVIICLSHSGTNEKESKSEDVQLAKKAPGIDLIISGHTHTRLDRPIKQGNTLIVSCGSYGYDVGYITLVKSGSVVSVKNYQLIPVSSGVEKDREILDEIESFRGLVQEKYFAGFGYDFLKPIARSDFSFAAIDEFGRRQGDDALGNLISDSYAYAVKKAEGESYVNVDVSVVPAGVVRSSFTAGDISAADVFDVSSLGIGADGLAGYPLVSVYLTGAELKTVAEIDVSVSDIMPQARLYMNGLIYEYNPNRLFLNRVTDVRLAAGDGSVPLEEDRLYRVVSGLYSCQMLSEVESKSFGLLKLAPKDSEGNEITDFIPHIIYDGGTELKEWAALAGYLESFDVSNGLPDIPRSYETPAGRKLMTDSKSLTDILKSPNRIFFMLLAAAVIALAVAAVIIAAIVRAVKKRNYTKRHRIKLS